MTAARAKTIFEIPEIAGVRRVHPQGRPARAARAVPQGRVTIMLDPDVIEHFKADGKGWQTRVNAALRKAAGLCA